MTLTEKGIKVSEELAGIIGAENGECFYNALQGLMTADMGEAYYVEGVASNEVLLCHHGWLELPGGLIVDPTPCYYERDKRLSPAAYYPAKRWLLHEVVDIMENDDDLLLPLLGWDGREFKSREYRDAYRAAAYDTFPGRFADTYLSTLNKAYPNEEEVA